ncbi:hypothetical protein UFOVP276_132 [uncultured Caudovirales phage]|uniref:PKD domain-containing protein n=1 Tax=uncultured Caudovirales phage TaxID=2100421 RepID=A0A6J5LGN5_9CAUD|nr:hypothetical protein UFOVP127_26 [uncultured Caudovirales phage]CAB4135176.1 hypothetical protein UFOVP276_132 [uncultured Caudovirales phage]
MATGFITRWTVSGDASARTITLPLLQKDDEYYQNLSYNCTVYWGDGTQSTVTSYDDTNRTHTYASNGTYDVEIRGTCEGFSFQTNGEPRVIGVIDWGNASLFNGFKNLREMFCYCSNFATTGTGKILASGNGPKYIPDIFSVTALTTVQAGLFDNLVNLESMEALFDLCSSFNYCPPDLFRYNTKVQSYKLVFEGCGALTSIPNDLFRYSPLAEVFQECFRESGLTSIPTDLFRYNPLATSFDDTFFLCHGLTAVPDGLFAYNPNVTTFSQCFYGCESLVFNPQTFWFRGSRDTRFHNKSVEFNQCFYDAGNGGTAPELWWCDFGTGTPITTACWNSQASTVTNYSHIPTAWGGPYAGAPETAPADPADSTSYALGTLLLLMNQ